MNTGASGVEAVLSLDLEAQKVDIELPRLFQRKDAEGRDNTLEFNRHGKPP